MPTVEHVSNYGEVRSVTKTYLDDEVQHMPETTYTRLHPTYFGHENVQFLHHHIIAVCIITRNAQDLHTREHAASHGINTIGTYLLFKAILLE